MNTLDAYVVHYLHNKVLKPTSKFCCKIFNKMSLQVFGCKTGREYGLGNFCLSNSPWATELNLSTNEELVGIPTNKLKSLLAGFRKLQE